MKFEAASISNKFLMISNLARETEHIIICAISSAHIYERPVPSNHVYILQPIYILSNDYSFQNVIAHQTKH